MSKTYTLPISPIEINIVRQQPGKLTAAFQPAPAQPAPGAPGVTAGETTYSGSAVTVSLGKRDKINPETWRVAGGSLANWAQKNHAAEVQIDLDTFDTVGVGNALASLCEGLLLGAYRFDRYKNSDEKKTTTTIYLATSQKEDEYKSIVERVKKVADAVNLARDWAHEPANVINPVSLAERVTELAQERNLKATVLDDKKLAEMGAGAIVGVGQGSKTPSRLILLEYAGQGAQTGTKPLVVVGKAITFDSGGYSMKDSNNIQGMKYDKSGAMAVIAIVLAASELGLKTPVTGVIAAAENMVSAQSYRPDDIIKTLWGKTVEIISTDAEGRLVLADALAYTQKNLNPRAMVDFATLTGAVIVALGKVRAGFMSNNDQLAEALFSSGQDTFERLWRLPLDEEYEQQIKGNDADIKNSGGREAGTIIGGTFLKEFVDPQVPWAHIDIAGTATTEKDLPYCQKGATGFGVRLIIDYLEKLES